MCVKGKHEQTSTICKSGNGSVNLWNSFGLSGCWLCGGSSWVCNFKHKLCHDFHSCDPNTRWHEHPNWIGRASGLHLPDHHLRLTHHRYHMGNGKHHMHSLVERNFDLLAKMRLTEREQTNLVLIAIVLFFLVFIVVQDQRRPHYTSHPAIITTTHTIYVNTDGSTLRTITHVASVSVNTTITVTCTAKPPNC